MRMAKKLLEKKSAPVGWNQMALLPAAIWRANTPPVEVAAVSVPRL
jgi:hypothetical protein